MSAGGPAPRRQLRGTKALVATLATGALLLTLSGTTRNGWLVLLAGLCLGLVAAAVALTPRLDRLAVDVALPARCAAGDLVEATVSVRNGSRRAVPASTLELAAPGIDPVRVALPPLRPGAVARADVPVRARSRGAVTDLGVGLRTSAPLGILASLASTAVATNLLVHPGPARYALALPGGRGDDGRPAPGLVGVDVHGVREWRRGEDARHLYARGTARHGRPLVLDRHDDLGDAIAVVVGGAAEHPAWESGVAVLAAALGDAADAGRQVALTAAGSRAADASAAGSADVMDWCARLARPGDPGPDDVLRAAGALGGGGAVVLLSTSWTASAPWWRPCVAAAERSGVDLLVLHPVTGRPDALCLHDARTDAHPEPA